MNGNVVQVIDLVRVGILYNIYANGEYTHIQISNCDRNSYVGFDCWMDAYFTDGKKVALLNDYSLESLQDKKIVERRYITDQNKSGENHLSENFYFESVISNGEKLFSTLSFNEVDTSTTDIIITLKNKDGGWIITKTKSLTEIYSTNLEKICECDNIICNGKRIIGVYKNILILKDTNKKENHHLFNCNSNSLKTMDDRIEIFAGGRIYQLLGDKIIVSE